MSRLFQKKTEDFICENCGHQVLGSGYTNHCPTCLYSKHVDVNPGDRTEICQGLMEPVGVEQNHGEYLIIHKCLKCHKVRKNKAILEDNFKLILELSQQP